MSARSTIATSINPIATDLRANVLSMERKRCEEREVLRRALRPIEPQLQEHAFKLLKRKADAEDLVQEAILRVWTGRRKWNQATHPDLFAFMCDVLKSLAYAWRQERKRNATPMFVADEGGLAIPISSTPERKLIRFEKAKHIAKRVANLRTWFGRRDERTCEATLALMLEGVHDQTEQAARIGVSIPKIHRAHARIRRLLGNVTEPPPSST